MITSKTKSGYRAGFLWQPPGLGVGKIQFCCRDDDLIIGHIRTFRGVRADYVREFIDGFNRINKWLAPADDMETGMFLIRTYTEHEYLTIINAIPAETTESWRGTTSVDWEAYHWPKPLLVAQFRYLRKSSRYWTV